VCHQPPTGSAVSDTSVPWAMMEIATWVTFQDLKIVFVQTTTLHLARFLGDLSDGSD
jgi:hypothetical protein